MSQNEDPNSPPKETFPPGTVLGVEGAAALLIIVIFEGTVVLSRHVDGSEVPMMHCTEGFLGLPEVLIAHPYFCTYTALTKVRVCRFTPVQFSGYLNEPAHPERRCADVRIIAKNIGTLYAHLSRYASGKLIAQAVPAPGEPTPPPYTPTIVGVPVSDPLPDVVLPSRLPYDPVLATAAARNSGMLADDDE